MFTRQRHIDTAALRRDYRTPVAPEVRRARFLASVWASCAEGEVRRTGTRLVAAGAYDRSAIMRAALAAARRRQGVSGAPWAVCLSDALRGVWKVARAQRAATRH